jgi:chromosome segregation ATPase
MWTSKLFLSLLALCLLCSVPLFCSDVASDKDQLLNDLSILETQLISLQVQIKTSETLISDLQTQIDNLKAQLAALTDESVNLKKQLETQTALLSDYEKQYQEQVAQYKTLSKRYDELKQSYNNSLIEVGIITGILALAAGALISHFAWK